MFQPWFELQGSVGELGSPDKDLSSLKSLHLHFRGSSKRLFILVSHIDFDFLYIKVPEINNNSKTYCFKWPDTHQKRYDSAIKAG